MLLPSPVVLGESAVDSAVVPLGSRVRSSGKLPVLLLATHIFGVNFQLSVLPVKLVVKCIDLAGRESIRVLAFMGVSAGGDDIKLLV